MGYEPKESFLIEKEVFGIMYINPDDVKKMKDACSTEEDMLVISELARTGLTIRELKMVKCGPILFPWL
jgi:hypothetical protein